MRVLVVYCHPNDKSFSSALHAAVIESLSASGHAVTDLDLYAEDFNPVLTRQERIEYSDSPQYIKTVEKYAGQLAAAEAIVAVYPTWWYGLPAMLKGYFDRVWAPGIAYDLSKDGSVKTDRLSHIRRIGVITTYGAPWWLIRFYMGDPERKLWSRGVRQLCARGCTLDWHAQYNMDRASPVQLDRFLARVKSKIATW
jgi:putative NADPH-quinone reductase